MVLSWELSFLNSSTNIRFGMLLGVSTPTSRTLSKKDVMPGQIIAFSALVSSTLINNNSLRFFFRRNLSQTQLKRSQKMNSGSPPSISESWLFPGWFPRCSMVANCSPAKLTWAASQCWDCVENCPQRPGSPQGSAQHGSSLKEQEVVRW